MKKNLGFESEVCAIALQLGLMGDAARPRRRPSIRAFLIQNTHKAAHPNRTYPQRGSAARAMHSGAFLRRAGGATTRSRRAARSAAGIKPCNRGCSGGQALPRQDVATDKATVGVRWSRAVRSSL